MRLLYNILIAALGFTFIIIEFFVPTAGIVGIVGAGCVVTGIVLTFTYFGVVPGTIFLVSCAIIGPIILFSYFKIFPKSFIGKRLILHKKFDKKDGFISSEKDNSLLSKEGIVETKLRPVGTIIIEDNVLNATTQGEFIEKGQLIEVIDIDGDKLIVSKKEK